ncbi:alpha/beta-hydrolase [Daedalea quercina L-15889]|uniref:Alpha/beta-hydrolase n=1 Tax=Daedalea quercina L-15889 TaxID=1314783 RepID=A0A165NDC5_9APHY|nr:alpha/beta-hydrolase [Daedalea quercina L-15889]
MKMQKGELEATPPALERKRPQSPVSLIKTAILCAAFFLCVAPYVHHLSFSSRNRSVNTISGATAGVSNAYNSDNPEFDWFSLPPSDNIEWTPCYSEYKCARLLLPLDYLSPPGFGPNATIALQMFPATDRENYKGTILINPGGPGGSGTYAVRQTGKNISRVVGGTYDILGFDPRGTGASLPAVQCYDSEAQYQIWMQSIRNTWVNLTEGAAPLMVAREDAVGQLCKRKIGGNGREYANGTAEEWGPGRFVSSAGVTTDMLHITEKLGEDKLKYWGFSYGSVLGQYFAAMYPDKIGRMVIDGVFDAYEYRQTSYTTNLVDNDAIIEAFFTFCHRAGPERCSLYEPSPQAIKSRVEGIINKVTNEPVPVPFAEHGPMIFTKKLLYELTFIMTYKPIQSFPDLATMLLGAEQNNGTAISSIVNKYLPDYECSCSRAQPWLESNEALMAIGCGDGDELTYDPGFYEMYLANMTAQSRFGGPFWAMYHVRCSQWRIRPKWRYTGPFAAANTSHPILIVEPRYDAVCPLSDARRVHKRYGGAALLVQNSYGHCSVSAPSLCTARYIRAYFEDGTLPEEGMECEVNELPFIGVVGDAEYEVLSTEDAELLDALRGLSKAVPVARPWR